MAKKKDDDFCGHFPRRAQLASFEAACHKAACAARNVDQGQRGVFEILLGLAEQHDADVDMLIGSLILSAANRQTSDSMKTHQLASALLDAIESMRSAHAAERKAAAAFLWALGMLNSYGRMVLAAHLAVQA